MITPCPVCNAYCEEGSHLCRSCQLTYLSAERATERDEYLKIALSVWLSQNGYRLPEHLEPFLSQRTRERSSARKTLAQIKREEAERQMNISRIENTLDDLFEGRD